MLHRINFPIQEVQVLNDHSDNFATQPKFYSYISLKRCKTAAQDSLAMKVMASKWPFFKAANAIKAIQKPQTPLPLMRMTISLKPHRKCKYSMLTPMEPRTLVCSINCAGMPPEITASPAQRTTGPTLSMKKSFLQGRSYAFIRRYDHREVDCLIVKKFLPPLLKDVSLFPCMKSVRWPIFQHLTSSNWASRGYLLAI